MITLQLPFPPSTNHYWKRNGRQYFISPAGRDYREVVAWEVKRQARTHKTFTGELSVTVELFPPDRRRRDLDNFAGKALYDALGYAAVFDDDSQVVETHHFKRERVAGGLCRVQILTL